MATIWRRINRVSRSMWQQFTPSRLEEWGPNCAHRLPLLKAAGTKESETGAREEEEEGRPLPARQPQHRATLLGGPKWGRRASCLPPAQVCRFRGPISGLILALNFIRQQGSLLCEPNSTELHCSDPSAHQLPTATL